MSFGQFAAVARWLWCGEPTGSQPSGRGRRDGTQQRPVRIGDSWSIVVPVQHCELVAQHDDLEVLRVSREHSQARQRDEQPVQRERHMGPQDASASCLVSAPDHIFGTHSVADRAVDAGTNLVGDQYSPYATVASLLPQPTPRLPAASLLQDAACSLLQTVRQKSRDQCRPDAPSLRDGRDAAWPTARSRES